MPPLFRKAGFLPMPLRGHRRCREPTRPPLPTPRHQCQYPDFTHTLHIFYTPLRASILLARNGLAGVVASNLFAPASRSAEPTHASSMPPTSISSPDRGAGPCLSIPLLCPQPRPHDSICQVPAPRRSLPTSWISVRLTPPTPPKKNDQATQAPAS